jgi:hypothetical protein
VRLTAVGDPPCSPRDTPLSTKFGTKFRQQVAVAQSVYFACGLKTVEFVLFLFVAYFRAPLCLRACWLEVSVSVLEPLRPSLSTEAVTVFLCLPTDAEVGPIFPGLLLPVLLRPAPLHPSPVEPTRSRFRGASCTVSHRAKLFGH